MSEPKYYTPAVEEFHIGFEYEYKHKPHPKGEWGEWKKETFEDIMIGYGEQIFPLLPSPLGDQDEYTKFRVKYLDENDIIELNWVKNHDTWQLTPDNSSPDDLDVFTLKVGDLTDHGFSVIISHIHNLPNEVGVEEEERFNGYVRNKSHLKDMMFSSGIPVYTTEGLFPFIQRNVGGKND